MWCGCTATSTRTPTTPCPCTLLHSPRSRRAAWSTAALWASEAIEMEPLPQFHTPTGTDTTATPQTRSSGSHPAACSRSASSTERSEVMPRSLDGGAGDGQGLGALRASRPGRPARARRPGPRSVLMPAAPSAAGSATGSKSLKRRTRLPRSVQSMTSSPAESSRSTTSMVAPCSSSPASCSRTCLRASWREAMCALLTCSTSAGPMLLPHPPMEPSM